MEINRDTVANMKEVFLNLPVAINTNYGDGFQPSQWENTLSKIQSLKNSGHKGEVMIASKWVLSENQISELYEMNPDIWIFCGVNGSDESPLFTTEERIDNYLRLCSVFKKVVLTLRPIIPNRNDSIEKLLPSIEAASKGRKLLHHGGFRDPFDFSNKKYTYDKLKPVISQVCSDYAVKEFPKSCCLIADYYNKPCETCSSNKPQNLDILKVLGFHFAEKNNKIQVKGYKDSPKITKGDISFVRHIAKTSLVSSEWTDFHENMQMTGSKGQTLIATSSWIGWSRQWYNCYVACDYCMVKPGLPIHYEAGDAGENPNSLCNFLLLQEGLNG